MTKSFLLKAHKAREAAQSVIHIARCDLRLTFRFRETWLFAFLMPLIFTVFFGTALSSSFSQFGPGSSRPLLVTVPENAGFLADEFLAHVARRGFDVRKVDAAAKAEEGRTLAIPGDYTESLLNGRAANVVFEPGRGNPGAELDRFHVNRAVALMAADLAVARTLAIAEDRPPEDLRPADFAKIRAIPRTLTLNVTYAGKSAKIPDGMEQAVPGIMVMFAIISLISVAATNLLMERRAGILSRLASAPVAPLAIVAGKMLARWVLGMVQVLVLMLSGRLLFGIHWGSEIPAILLVMSAYVALLSCLGLLIGSIANTEAQSIGGGILLMTVLAALGGCWFPIEVAPAWMQQFSMFLPTGLTMSALHHLVSFGDPASAVVPHVLGLALGTCGVAYIAARRFRFQ